MSIVEQVGINAEFMSYRGQLAALSQAGRRSSTLGLVQSLRICKCIIWIIRNDRVI